MSGRAYVSYSGEDARVVDITDPSTPRFVPGASVPWARNYAARGGLLLGAAYPDGVWVMDITEPDSPHEIGRVALPGPAFGIAIDGDRAYVACDVSGVQVIDLARPADPVLLGCLQTPGRALDVAVIQGRLIVADEDRGLWVATLACTGTPASDAPSILLSAPYPNPGRRSISIAFDAGSAPGVELAVYGVDGRLVRRLYRGTRSSGEVRLLWDGADERGRRLPAGVYFLELQGAAVRAARKIVLAP